MPLSRRVAGSLVAAAALVAGLGVEAPASAQTAHALIAGSGSSWASNEVNQWVASVHPLGLQVVYTSDGSAAGKQDFANKTSDFAVTDVPYLGFDEATGVNDTSQGRDYGDVPIAAGGTSFPFHLVVNGTLDRSLRLSGLTLAKIFTGQITNWDSPAITADNNGVKLPSLRIRPVVQSEGSGVTWNFTTYLADQYPKIWQAYAANSRPTQYWPKTGNQYAENGSDALMNYIKSPSSNGTIGAVEYAYALGANYPVVSLENQAGYYVQPTQYDVAIALRSATIDENPDDANYMRPDLAKVFAAKDRRAYPLSSYSSMLIPTSATDSRMTTAKRQTLADFSYYALCEGQKSAGALGYAPLPLNLVTAGFTQLDRLKTADPDVDITHHDVAHCGNPTFLAANLHKDQLGSIAPEPSACEKQGQGPCGVTTLARLAASTRTVKAGHEVVLRGRLTYGNAAGAPPRAVTHLQRRLPHDAWTTIATKNSATATFTRRPSSTARYRIVATVPGARSVTSEAVRITVTKRPKSRPKKS